MPRVNLFIADDVGLGKTIEAGLIARELLLRRRIDRIVVACPPSMLDQWRDEMETRFGLAFTILDRTYLTRMRRERGFSVNPWTTHSRFLVSHRLLIDEAYASGLRDWLGEFAPQSLLILDEAHNAAPSSGVRYAIDSQITRAVRDIAPRFEHRLFLSATPHNGHSNSFSALLEILDPQRFCRGVRVLKGQLEEIMVRRLKSDVRALEGGFPRRAVVQIDIDGLPTDAPDLVLAEKLHAYRLERENRLKDETRSRQAAGALVIGGLQKRLLSSIEAFAGTLAVHRKSVERALKEARESENLSQTLLADLERMTAGGDPDAAVFETAGEDDGTETTDGAPDLSELEFEERMARATAASSSAGRAAKRAALERELALVNEMREIAEANRHAADPRMRKIVVGGLITALMRLVFVLYTEDRGLMPNHPVYQQHYSLGGLFAKLRADAAAWPDTMDQRFGAWAQLLSLFRLIHGGGGHGDLRFVARKGGLFDPGRFPFLEGRAAEGAVEIPPAPDLTVWNVLRNLMMLDGERLSYRTLDVEQIGSVYEAVMGFRIEWTTGRSIAVRSRNRTGAAVVVDLDGREVETISAFLFHRGGHDDPALLKANARKSFQGSIVLGMGFTFDDTDSKGIATPLAAMQRLIDENPRNREVIFPYIGGEEVNTSPTHKHHRYVVNFRDYPLRREDLGQEWRKAGEDRRREWLQAGIAPPDYPAPVAADWPELLTIVEEKVKPERDAQNDRGAREKWWQFIRSRPKLHAAITGLGRVLAINCGAMPQFSFTFLPADMVFAHSLAIFPYDTYAAFCALQSRAHEIWARFFGSSMKDDLRYTPSECFETFPFPDGWATHPALEAAGREYYEFRAGLMLANGEGLTKTYNRFHDPEERSPQVAKLRELHATMDRAVLDTYGWRDIATDCAFLLDYAVDEEAWGKKKKPWRHRWSDAVRDEILARLPALNAERARQERRPGAAPGKAIMS